VAQRDRLRQMRALQFVLVGLPYLFDRDYTDAVFNRPYRRQRVVREAPRQGARRIIFIFGELKVRE
jgi:hypothetical protein